MILNKARFIRLWLLAALFSATLIFAQSCGLYKFNDANVGTAKTISIDLIQNKSSYVSPTLSQLFTEKIKDKFIRETTLKLVESNGDMQISGNIIEYTITPVALQGTTQTSQNRLTIKSSIKFVNKTDEKLNFEEVFTNFTDFDASVNFSTIESELNNTVISMTIQDVFNKAVINW